MAQNETKDSDMVFPREVLIGKGYLSKMPGLLERLKIGRNLLVVCGRNTANLAGNELADMLQEKGYRCDVIIEDRATEKSVERVHSLSKGFDAIIAVGGGSKIDIAKLAAHLENIPFISVPTTASHDGIASPRASIERDGSSISVEASAPVAIVADTGIVSKAPYRLLASGCADLIAKKSSVKDWELANRLRNEPFSSFASALAMLACNTVIDSADIIKEGLEESAWIVMKSLVLSGVSMSIAGSSRPASGAEHLFAHALDRIAPGKALHGEECGVGTIIMLYLHGEDWRSIRDVLRKIKAPTSALELGVSDGDIIEALTMAHEMRKDRYTILGDSGISRSAAERAARITEVIG
jgi:glycerol-1-phosphate dehydrogenase [NAD(P)+]